MRASDLFVKALENEDVEYVLHREENLDFLESLRKSKKIGLVMVREAFRLAHPDPMVGLFC